MTIGILFAVLGAAFLHALWNAMIKIGSSKVGGMMVLSIAEIPIGLAVGLSRPVMAAQVWPWVAAAGCTHFAYKSFLTFAYDHGDLSRVYPIARGAAPMVVLLVGGFVLADQIEVAEYLGIVILGIGILLMTRGVFSSGEERKLLPFALGSAGATATYTLLDGMGARVAGDAVAYVGSINLSTGSMEFNRELVGAWRKGGKNVVASAIRHGRDDFRW